MSVFTGPVALLLIGALAGVASGVFGIGGGLLLVPLFLYLAKMEPHRATATSLAIVVLPIALPAVLRFHRAGNVDWRVVVWVALGFAVANSFGARLNLNMSETLLRRSFAVLLIFAAVQMAFKKPKAPAPVPPPQAEAGQVD